jgi:hypothetical protein
MKQFGNLKTLFVAGAAVAALASLSSAQAQEAQGQGSVRMIKGGTATYQTGGGVSMPLKKGDVLPPGSTVSAGRECVVDIYLGRYNGPTLRVTSDTTVSLDILTYSGTGEEAVSTTKLNLQDGRILGSVRKLGRDSTYEIKTPTGVAGIRGTDYDISTRKNAAGKYESTYICVSGTIVGTDSSTGTSESFVANTGQGHGPQGNFTPPPADLQNIINQLGQSNNNTGGQLGGNGLVNGPVGGAPIANPTLVFVAPTLPPPLSPH